MTIKKVTIEDLESIRGGAKPGDKVKRVEKKVIRELTKDYKKDIIAKNNKKREGTPITEPGHMKPGKGV